MMFSEDIEAMLEEIKKMQKDSQTGGVGKITLADLIIPDEAKPADKIIESLKQLKNKRNDGRPKMGHRPLFIQLGTVSDTRGSCYMEIGDTKVLVSVQGPKEIPNIKEYMETCEIECLVEYSPFANTDDNNAGYLSHALQQALEPVVCRHEFPNLQITVCAFILEDGGSVLSAIITGASLSLLHARIPCFGIVTSVSAVVRGDLILIDPTSDEESTCLHPEENESQGLITVAYMSEMEQITFYEQTGRLLPDQSAKLIDTLVNKCQEVHKTCSQYALKEAKKSVKLLVDAENAATNLQGLHVS